MKRRPGIIPLFLAIATCTGMFAACGSPDTPPTPAPTDTVTPEMAYDHLFDDAFFPVSKDGSGSGAFGAWEPDPYGMPAYRYTIDQDSDPRAAYFTSRGSSRDHWHQLGNDAVTLTAHNGGYIQFWDWRRGGKCINRYRPERDGFSGGFRFLHTANATWNTLYEPGGFSRYERLFGTGYAQKEALRDGLRVIERTYAPFGRDPIVISETRVTNTTAATREVTLYEYWDFNLYELLLAPIMTAPLGAVFDATRWAFNKNFQVDTFHDPEHGLLTVVPYLAPGKTAPGPEDIAIRDYYPSASFLVCLSGQPEIFYTDQRALFGKGGVDQPEAIVRQAPSRLLRKGTRDIERACLVFGKRIRLAPGETASVAYAFGTAPRDSILPLVEKYREKTASPFDETMGNWIRQRADFVSPGYDWLRREVLWHSYYLPSGAFVEDYFGGSIVNQGSAYGYVHGMNGAHRDFALFSMPLSYLRPELAREVLGYTLRSQHHLTGKIPYAHQGYGFTSGYVVHEMSSDLDLFFLLAMAEYLGATRDFAFLDAVFPYYPLSSGATAPVRDHLVKALDHLEQYVGTGPNGLIRAGSGDWNDVLIAFSPCPVKTMIRGESNLNTGLACYLFPRLADLLRPHLPEFSQRLERLGQDWRKRLLGEWSGGWMRRGALGDGTYMGEDRLFLDAQAWPLLARLWNDEQAGLLLTNIHEMLVKPSPAGALCLYPPYPAPLVQGSDTNGGTWSAVDSWLVWAWSLYDPTKAWECFLKSTLHRHAEAYPNIWYGVWSGPDSYNAYYADRPGETFNWSVTPMTDFPVMNMNRHSGPLLDVIRLAGIDPAGERIAISPAVPFSSFALRLPLIGLAYLPDRHRGYYQPVAAGTFPFSVRLPVRLDGGDFRLLVNGTVKAGRLVDGHVEFEVTGDPAAPIRWEILPKDESGAGLGIVNCSNPSD